MRLHIVPNSLSNWVFGEKEGQWLVSGHFNGNPHAHNLIDYDHIFEYTNVELLRAFISWWLLFVAVLCSIAGSRFGDESQCCQRDGRFLKHGAPTAGQSRRQSQQHCMPNPPLSLNGCSRNYGRDDVWGASRWCDVAHRRERLGRCRPGRNDEERFDWQRRYRRKRDPPPLIPKLTPRRGSGSRMVRRRIVVHYGASWHHSSTLLESQFAKF